MSTLVNEDPTATDLLEKVSHRLERLLRQHDKYADAKKREARLWSDLEDLQNRCEHLLSRADDLETDTKRRDRKLGVDVSDLQNEAQKLRWKAEDIEEEIGGLETEIQRVGRTIESVEDGKPPSGRRSD